MKKIIALMVAGVTVFALSGCTGGDDDYAPPPVDMLYIDDVLGFGQAGIEYHCTSGEYGDTDPQGGFYFDPRGDTCTFEDLDWIGTDLFLAYASGKGVPFVQYECGPPPVVVGETGDNGYFFDSSSPDEYCILYL